ncbi:MAG TPA: hypothetical protein VLS89_05580 [Candidatus Nanopelagicales bacterium]|nr:hypothetical protein [Candidatus Nanopelagicales bacterium]
MDPCPNDPDGWGDADSDGLLDCADPCPEDPANTDTDLDAVCDGTDNCPAVPNPEQENCNLDAEIAAGTPILGDACDSVPCVRARQGAEVWGSAPLSFAKTTVFDVEPIRTPSSALAPAFVGAWGHRFCECPDADGTPEAVSRCAETHGCVLNADFDDPPEPWEATSIGIESPPTLDASFVHTFSRPAELQADREPVTLERLHWDASPDSATPVITRRGVHWFHIRNAVCSAPPCAPSGVSQATLDGLANHYWAGPAGEQMIIGGMTEVPTTFGWWLPPAPDCPVCAAFDVLPFAHALPDGTLAMRTPGGDLAIEQHLTAPTVKALRQGAGLRWLAPAESGALVDGAEVRLASIMPDGTVAGPALRRGASGRLELYPGALTGSGPGARSRFGALLRGTIGDVLVIGGLLPSGRAAGDAWRYDISAGRWHHLVLAGAMSPGAVLATAYDARRRRLLVLDEAAQKGATLARLWWIHVPTGTTRMLGAWPRYGESTALEMAATAEGGLVVIASAGTGASMRVARLHVDEAKVTLQALWSTVGAPASVPRADGRGVHLLVHHEATGITAQRISWSAFRAPDGITLGDLLR